MASWNIFLLLCGGICGIYGDRTFLLQQLNDRVLFPQLNIHKIEMSTEERVDINNLVDDQLALLRRLVIENQLDPINFPSDSSNFTFTLYNQTLDGSFAVSNFRVGGFAGLHRTGDCNLNPIQLRAQVNFGTNDIVFGVDLSFGAWILRTNLKLQVTIAHVSLMMDVGFPPSGLTLRDFKINEIGAIRFDVEGIPMGSARLSNLLNFLANAIKDSLLYAFQEALKPIIESILTNQETQETVLHFLQRDLIQKNNV